MAGWELFEQVREMLGDAALLDSIEQWLSDGELNNIAVWADDDFDLGIFEEQED